ncbi:hypothetical protein CLF_109444 [Clonorchis sinensis]|uniref:C2H2-type domain-containing protein n=1 Tax=Clonorchis sinensis TaxID=79923 RepID=G7YSM1_CLOSI|nr:hypothetical protein CLF_109444 [Clonorchis sinensis]
MSLATITVELDFDKRLYYFAPTHSSGHGIPFTPSSESECVPNIQLRLRENARPVLSGSQTKANQGYPASLIRRQLRRVLVPVEKPKREWLGTAVIPYKPGTSETIRRILNTANIRVGFQRGNTLRSALVQLKDRLPANRTRDCVYKIKCSDCIKCQSPSDRLRSAKTHGDRRISNCEDFGLLSQMIVALGYRSPGRIPFKDLSKVRKRDSVELPSSQTVYLHAHTNGKAVHVKSLQKRRVLVPVEKPKREWLGTAVIPYKPGTSETIRRILNTANIRVGFQRGNTLRSALVQLKDRLPANRTRDCVYKIKCSDCIKVYIGQTARELHTRIVEHKRKINKPPRNADEYRALLKDSAIAEHALDTGHKIDLENVEVLRRGLRSASQRLMAEAVEIAKHPSVNRIEGVELARVWRTVLDQSSCHVFVCGHQKEE